MRKNIISWIILLLLSTFAHAAAAEEKSNSCNYIATADLRDCFGMSNATINSTNIENIKYSEKTYTYKNTKANHDRYLDYKPYCPKGKCECQESLHYLKFSGTQKALGGINSIELKNVKSQKCSIDSSDVTREPRFAYASKNFISTVIFSLDYCRGCGGSCHGGTSLETYNADTGTVYHLSDVVSESNFSKLKDELTKDFYNKNYKDNKLSDYNKTGILEALENKHGGGIGKNNIYVEKEKVFVDIPYFVSCADGNFHPTEIPKNLIKPDFLELLEKDKEADNAKR